MFNKQTYRCVVEGQQERLYLNHIANLLTDFPKSTVTFNISEGNANELSKSYAEYDSACLFDFDFNKAEFENNLLTCIKENNKCSKKSKKLRNRIFHAYSNVCFDLWLILHKKDYFSCVSTSDSYVSEVRRTYGLPREADIKDKKVMEQILSQITLDDVKSAIIRARKIKSRKLETDAIKVANEKYYENPDFSIHEFLDYVIIKSKK